MNDTHAEARRLLVTAAQDMPPGIDLLAGFAVARRRDRARRMRGRAVLSAGVAAAAASAMAVALTSGSAPPALTAFTSALTRGLTQSYHLTWLESSHYVQNGQITGRASSTCVTDADPVRHLESDFCPPDDPGTREVGGYTYIYYTDPTGHPGKHWERIPTASLRAFPIRSPEDFLRATPQQMLSEIEKDAKVTVAGPASGPGWTGTRYAFAVSPGGGTTISGTADVDQQGRARALVVTERDTGPVNVFVTTQHLTFSDLGMPVTVTPPPADQTFPGP
jgi:hypothetical protein